jgi:hypothetical protein
MVDLFGKAASENWTQYACLAASYDSVGKYCSKENTGCIVKNCTIIIVA